MTIEIPTQPIPVHIAEACAWLSAAERYTGPEQTLLQRLDAGDVINILCDVRPPYPPIDIWPASLTGDRWPVVTIFAPTDPRSAAIASYGSTTVTATTRAAASLCDGHGDTTSHTCSGSVAFINNCTSSQPRTRSAAVNSRATQPNTKSRLPPAPTPEPRYRVRVLGR